MFFEEMMRWSSGRSASNSYSMTHPQVSGFHRLVVIRIYWLILAKISGMGIVIRTRTPEQLISSICESDTTSHRISRRRSCYHHIPRRLTDMDGCRDGESRERGIGTDFSVQEHRSGVAIGCCCEYAHTYLHI